MAGHGYGHEKTSGPFFGRSYPGLGDYKSGYVDKAIDTFHGGKSAMEKIRDQVK